MAARIYSQFSEKKITNSSPPKDAGPGSGGSVTVKQSFTSNGLPGKASNGFAEAKRGYKEVNGYAAYEGLSSGGKKWIQGAIKHKGALTRSAKRVGESPMEFAREHQHDKGVTGKRARLALTLRKMHH